MRPEDGPLGLRRATAMFSLVTWAGVVLVLVMGVMMITRSTGDGPSTVSLRRTVAAGEPLDMVASTSARLVFGAPADVDLAEVSCVGTAPSGDRELDLVDDPRVVTDRDSGAERVLLLRVETMPLVQAVTCSGGGLENIGSTAAGNAGIERIFGVLLILLAPVLAVVGLVARRASRPPAR